MSGAVFFDGRTRVFVCERCGKRFSRRFFRCGLSPTSEGMKQGLLGNALRGSLRHDCYHAERNSKKEDHDNHA